MCHTVFSHIKHDTGFDYRCVQLPFRRTTKIYPTLFHDILVIDKAATGCEVRMALYNMLGQVLIENMPIQNGVNKINLSPLAAGMYFCVFFSGDKVLRTEKLLKASQKY